MLNDLILAAIALTAMQTGLDRFFVRLGRPGGCESFKHNALYIRNKKGKSIYESTDLSLTIDATAVTVVTATSTFQYLGFQFDWMGVVCDCRFYFWYLIKYYPSFCRS